MKEISIYIDANDGLVVHCDGCYVPCQDKIDVLNEVGDLLDEQEKEGE